MWLLGCGRFLNLRCFFFVLVRRRFLNLRFSFFDCFVEFFDFVVESDT
jgi:hypothetical protein